MKLQLQQNRLINLLLFKSNMRHISVELPSIVSITGLHAKNCETLKGQPLKLIEKLSKVEIKRTLSKHVSEKHSEV